MNVSVNGTDVTKYMESIGWSGDENQLARKVTVAYLYAPQDPNLNNITIQKGDRLLLTDGGVLFDGIVVAEERNEGSVRKTNVAYDYAWYLRNKAIGAWEGSPAEVAAQVCAEFGIPCGRLYDPETQAEVISTGEKTVAQVIQAAYEGQDAHIYMEGSSLCVERYGETLAGVVTGDDSVIDATYKSSIENLVNQVVLLDAAEHPVGQVDNGLFEYGTIREVYKASGDEKDAAAEAKKLLSGIEDSGRITVIGDPALRTGRAVIVEKAGTRIRGLFTIISDEHTVKEADYTTTLGLRFEEVA